MSGKDPSEEEILELARQIAALPQPSLEEVAADLERRDEAEARWRERHMALHNAPLASIPIRWPVPKGATDRMVPAVTERRGSVNPQPALGEELLGDRNEDGNIEVRATFVFEPLPGQPLETVRCQCGCPAVFPVVGYTRNGTPLISSEEWVKAHPNP